MSKHELNDADKAFMEFIQNDDGFSKRAVELDPDTEDLLGIPSVSPSILDKLEAQASSPQTIQKPVPDPPPPEPSEEETLSGAQAELESHPQDEPEDPVVEPEAEEAAPQELESFDNLDMPAEVDEEQEEEPAPDLPRRATHGHMFCDKRCHPLQLMDVLNMRYKTNWPEWEPETLWWSIRRDFGSVGEITANKIQALRLAVSTDIPWLDWDVFENCGLAWNDIVPIFGAWQPMTPMQVAFTVHVLRGVRAEEEFADEVNAYIAAVLEEHGWVYAPEEWFAGAQEFIDRKKWLAGFKTEVADAWERVRNVDPSTVTWREDNPLDVHIVKMMVVQRYLEARGEHRQEIPGVASPELRPVP